MKLLNVITTVILASLLATACVSDVPTDDVWNPPPFMPVEGYTSFLWVAILDFFWRITGLTPPQSSNWLSLIFSYLTLITSSMSLAFIFGNTGSVINLS